MYIRRVVGNDVVFLFNSRYVIYTSTYKCCDGEEKIAKYNTTGIRRKKNIVNEKPFYAQTTTVANRLYRRCSTPTPIPLHSQMKIADFSKSFNVRLFGVLLGVYSAQISSFRPAKSFLSFRNNHSRASIYARRCSA